MTFDAASGNDIDIAAARDAIPAIDPNMTLAQYAETAARAPQPAVTTLAALQERSFTGQVTFATEPAVRVYFDRGTPYYAERDDDPSISAGLLDAGVLTAAQIERGTVRVGDVENLGRLFDRDDSVDRDAVMVAVEAHTDLVLARLTTTVSAIQLHSFRHHPSGLHRWFVKRTESTPASRPVSDVAQVDRSVVDELPALGSAAAHMSIEWDTSDDAVDEPHPAATAANSSWGQLSVADEIYIEAELNRFDADHADWAGVAGSDPTIIQPAGDLETAPTLPEVTSPSTPPDEFQILWPDGTEQPAAAQPSTPAMPLSELPTPAPGAAPVEFESPKIVIDHVPEPGEEVPVDVADAVRQALAAIASASTATPDLPTLEVAPAEVPALGFLRPTESATPAETVASPAARHVDTPASDEIAAAAAPAPPPVAESAFAPPTADTRAEVMYAKAAAEIDAAMEQIAGLGVTDTAEIQSPAPAAGDDDDSRAGALKRLIGSLRRRD